MQSLSTAEVAFLGGELPVTIVPKIKLERLTFVCGEITELKPAIPVEVPLWIAAYLKRRDKCRINVPPWLEVEALEATLAEERNASDVFARLPFRYIEQAKELLLIASDDLPQPQKIRTLLADIEDNRRTKVQRGLQSIDEHASSVRVSHLSAMELNSIREIAASYLDTMRKLDVGRGRDDGADASQQPSQSQEGGGNERLAGALRRRSGIS